MDEAARTRRAARTAIQDIDPPALHETIDDVLAGATMTPGALTLRFAAGHDDRLDPDRLGEHAAGVQLIYDGLRLTRDLSHTEPWTNDATASEGDMGILAADVLVSRGFYLLAHTAAAGQAVETVRAFGRDETVRRTDGAADRAAELERNVLELAVIAGASAAGTTVSDADRHRARELAADGEPALPPVETALTAFPAVAPVDPGPADDGVHSATDR